jgi:hypothetical protein
VELLYKWEGSFGSVGGNAKVGSGAKSLGLMNGNRSLTIIKGLSQPLASVRDIGAKILLVVVDLHEQE